MLALEKATAVVQVVVSDNAGDVVNIVMFVMYRWSSICRLDHQEAFCTPGI